MSHSQSGGFVVFLVSYFGLKYLFGPTTCNDGWHSPSIGKQGACSWHGGVNNTPQFLSFLASVFVGLVVYALCHWRELKRQEELQAAWNRHFSQATLRDELVPINNEAQ